jgi:hypothetical protein
MYNLSFYLVEVNMVAFGSSVNVTAEINAPSEDLCLNLTALGF